MANLILIGNLDSDGTEKGLSLVQHDGKQLNGHWKLIFSENGAKAQHNIFSIVRKITIIQCKSNCEISQGLLYGSGHISSRESQ